MFDKQREWLQDFIRSEVATATKQAKPSAPATPAVTRQLAPAPHGAQWPAAPDPNLPPELVMRQMRVVGTILTEEQVFAGDADYEAPMPNREISADEWKTSAEDFYVQIHAETNILRSHDKQYRDGIAYDNDGYVTAHKGADTFAKEMKAAREYKESTIHGAWMSAQDPPQQKATHSINMGGVMFLNYDDAGGFTITGDGGMGYVQGNIQVNADLVIAAFQRMKTGKSSNVMKIAPNGNYYFEKGW
jgi:hypothetical protein